MPGLVTPTTRLHRRWLDARDDRGRGVHQDGSGLHAGDDVDSAAGFAAWIAGLTREADPAQPTAEGRVHGTCRWIGEGDAEASRRTIERHGGVLEDVRDTEPGRLNRYRIGLV